MSAQDMSVLSPLHDVDPLLAAAQAEIDNSRLLRHPHDRTPHSSKGYSPPSAPRSAPPQFTPVSDSPSPSRRALPFDATAESLEEALTRIRSLTSELAVMKSSMKEADAARTHTSRLLEAECRRRQDAELQLQLVRQEAEERSATCEALERKLRNASISLTQLTEELHHSSGELQRLQHLQKAFKEQEISSAKHLFEVTHERDTLQRQLDLNQEELKLKSSELVEAKRRIDTLSGEAEDARKHHDASLQLWKAQQASSCASLQTDVDQLTLQLREAMRKSELLESTNANEVKILTERLDRCQESLHLANADVDRLQIEVRHSADDLRRQSLEWESTKSSLIQEITVLKQQISSFSSTLESERREKAALEGHLAESKDVQHVLAVRLKSAAAEVEALAMEAEARKLLERQNGEMEKQLFELRRTIQSLMGTQNGRPTKGFAH